MGTTLALAVDFEVYISRTSALFISNQINALIREQSRQPTVAYLKTLTSTIAQIGNWVSGRKPAVSGRGVTSQRLAALSPDPSAWSHLPDTMESGKDNCCFLSVTLLFLLHNGSPADLELWVLPGHVAGMCACPVHKSISKLA